MLKSISLILLFGSAFLLMSVATVDARVSQADSDTTKTESGNSTITVTQKGSGNSVTISQSGSHATTTATVKATGNNNDTEISSGSDKLLTNITFIGEYNRMVSLPGPHSRFFTITSNPFTITGKTINFYETGYMSKQTEQPIRIHQTTDGVRINNKEQ